jgi:hypothetical protein
MDFRFFNLARLQGTHRAFRFRNKVNVLNFALVKRYYPVGIILADTGYLGYGFEHGVPIAPACPGAMAMYLLQIP